MLFSVNKKIMQTLKDSKWSPSTITALENLLNTKTPYTSFSACLAVVKSWCDEIIDDNNLKEIMNDLKHTAECLYEYYKTLLEYSEGIYDVVKTESSTKFAKVSAKEKVIKIIERLNKYDIESERRDIRIDLSEIFDDLKFAYNPICTDLFKINLKTSLTQENVTTLYLYFLHCNLVLYDFIADVQKIMLNKYSDVWEAQVFSLENRQIIKKEHLTGAHNLIVSFCNDTAKYDNSSQRIISACLHDTSMSSTYQNRAFGFLYDFNPDDVLAMSTSDVYSYTSPIKTLPDFLGALFQGVPMHNLTQVVQMFLGDLKPIYDYTTFKFYTFKYNEIVLKETAKPYGILVNRDDLYEVLPDVFSLVISKQLPLFIRNRDGSLDVIPCNVIYDSIKIKFSPLGF